MATKYTINYGYGLLQISRTLFQQQQAEIAALRAQLAEFTHGSQERPWSTSVELSHIAELLRAARTAQGKSLGDLQAATGIKRENISRLETQPDSNPRIDTLSRIAEALGKKLVVALVEEESAMTTTDCAPPASGKSSA